LDCPDNCGCKVRLDHIEIGLKCAKKEIGWMRKLLIGNLVTGIVILLGVVFQLVVWLARTGQSPQ